MRLERIDVDSNNFDVFSQMKPNHRDTAQREFEKSLLDMFSEISSTEARILNHFLKIRRDSSNNSVYFQRNDTKIFIDEFAMRYEMRSDKARRLVRTGCESLFERSVDQSGERFWLISKLSVLGSPLEQVQISWTAEFSQSIEALEIDYYQHHNRQIQTEIHLYVNFLKKVLEI